jgi:hypothetical protein
MKRFLTVYFTIITCVLFSQTPPNRTVNFTSNIAGATKFTSITTALSGAPANTIIWVAAGTYVENELIIPAGVTVIGGFPANATTYEQRIYPGVATAAQRSVLDGNYSHRVATVKGTLDGFTVKKGYTYIGGPAGTTAGYGGGVLIDGGIVQNCIIQNNVAAIRPPSPEAIPGTFVASIGDIYCTDGTILRPTYHIDANGKYIATLAASYFTGHIPMGIVYYVNPAPSAKEFFIMGIPKLNDNNTDVDKSYIWINTNPATDMPTVVSHPSVDVAKLDTAGFTNTRNMVTQGNTWATQNYNVGVPFGTGSNNPGKSGVKYARYYDFPAGTLDRWYLPAAAQMLHLWNVYPQMDACAKLLKDNGWAILKSLYTNDNSTIFPLTGHKYWTSSEKNANNVWVLDASKYPWSPASLGEAGKTDGNIVTIPVSTIKM